MWKTRHAAYLPLKRVILYTASMPGSFPPRASATLFSSQSQGPPEHYLIAHVDGGSRGNPGPAGYGVVITDENKRKIALLNEFLGHQTNNYAEYHGLLAALDYALKPKLEP